MKIRPDLAAFLGATLILAYYEANPVPKRSDEIPLSCPADSSVRTQIIIDRKPEESFALRLAETKFAVDPSKNRLGVILELGPVQIPVYTSNVTTNRFGRVQTQLEVTNYGAILRTRCLASK